MTVGETVIEEGDVVSIDGSTGKVYLGEVPVVPSPVVEYFEGRMHAGADDADELVAAVHRIMAYADRQRRGRAARPPLRRPGHRPVPHRAHVPR